MNFSPWILLLTLVLHGKLGQSFCLFPSKIGLWHEMPLTCLLSDIVESLLKVAFLALIGSGQKLILQQFRFFYRVLFYLFIKIHQPVSQFHVFLKNTYDYLWELVFHTFMNSWLTIHFEHVQNIPPITYVVFESFVDKIHHFSSAPDFLCHIFLTPLSI